MYIFDLIVDDIPLDVSIFIDSDVYNNDDINYTICEGNNNDDGAYYADNDYAVNNSYCYVIIFIFDDKK